MTTQWTGEQARQLLVDTTRFGPLPDEGGTELCTRCKCTVAHWALLPTDQEAVLPLCSLCFLYESNWGLARAGALSDFVEIVELELRRRMPRDDRGRLGLAADGDRILMAVFQASVLARLRDERSGGKKARGPVRPKPGKAPPADGLRLVAPAPTPGDEGGRE